MAERLHPDDLVALADLVANRVAEQLSPGARSAGGLVDAKTLAQLLGVSRDFVYERAAELGGVKLGTGSRAPWRFNVDRARAALTSSERPAPARRRRVRRTTTTNGTPLMAYEGFEA
jgi:hypothetical protein